LPLEWFAACSEGRYWLNINQSVSLLNVIDKRSDGTTMYKERKMSINISVQHADKEIISQEAGFSSRQH